MKAILKIKSDGSLPLPKEWEAEGFAAGQLVEAIRKKSGFFLHPVLASQASAARTPSRGRWAAFGIATKEEVAEIDRVIEEEFERIEPEDWK